MDMEQPHDLVQKDSAETFKWWKYYNERLGCQPDWVKLDRYVQELYRWSKVFNLVSHKDRNAFFTGHISASLAILPLILSVRHKRIIDFGSGSGLPGIPLAVCLPFTNVYLVESRRKKSSFLRQVKRSLCLDNVTIVDKRLEAVASDIPKVDIIVSRAIDIFSLNCKIYQKILTQSGIILRYTGPKQDIRRYFSLFFRISFSGTHNVITIEGLSPNMTP